MCLNHRSKRLCKLTLINAPEVAAVENIHESGNYPMNSFPDEDKMTIMFAYFYGSPNRGNFIYWRPATFDLSSSACDRIGSSNGSRHTPNVQDIDEMGLRTGADEDNEETSRSSNNRAIRCPGANATMEEQREYAHITCSHVICLLFWCGSFLWPERLRGQMKTSTLGMKNCWRTLC